MTCSLLSWYDSNEKVGDDMYIKHQFLQAQIAINVMEKHGFDLITITPNYEEIILRKTSKGKTDFIRLSMKQFDWQREMERSLQHVEKTVMTHFPLPLFNKKVRFHHLFLVDYEPVDSYQHLHNRQSFHSKVTNSYLYLLTAEKILDELDRLDELLKLNLPNQLMSPSDVSILQMEQLTRDIQRKLHSLQQAKQQNNYKLFHYGKPFFTYFFIVLNILAYLFIEYKGSSTSTETLIQYGAKYNVAIMDGEIWRLLSSMFLHIGAIHILLNMLALYFLGTLTERIYGSSRFLIIYLIAGISGSVASFAFNPAVSAGASGAIYGLFGALLYFGLNNREVFMKTIGMNVITILAINIIFGFMAPQIDVGGHFGGLIGGFIAAMATGVPNKKWRLKQFFGVVICIVGLIGLFLFGMNNDAVQKSELAQLQRIKEYMEQENYEEIVPTTTETLEVAEDNLVVAQLLFSRSYAYIQLNDNQKAIQDLEQAVEIYPEFEEAWYNLAILYYSEQDKQKAITAAEKLVELDSGNEKYKEILNDLMKFNNE